MEKHYIDIEDIDAYNEFVNVHYEENTNKPYIFEKDYKYIQYLMG